MTFQERKDFANRCSLNSLYCGENFCSRKLRLTLGHNKTDGFILRENYVSDLLAELESVSPHVFADIAAAGEWDAKDFDYTKFCIARMGYLAGAIAGLRLYHQAVNDYLETPEGKKTYRTDSKKKGAN